MKQVTLCRSDFDPDILGYTYSTSYTVSVKLNKWIYPNSYSRYGVLAINKNLPFVW